MNAVEAELTILLASVAARREAARDRIAELARRIDGPMYAARLDERGVLALLGTRLLALAPDAADELLRARVDAVTRDARIRALALELTLRQVSAALAEAGVRALPIKGLTFAERIYGDAGLRPATDVDVLVPRAQLARAVAVLRELGYGAPTDPLWAGGLPELHHRLAGPYGAPRVEVHWRTHWAEDGLSEDAIAGGDAGVGRSPARATGLRAGADHGGPGPRRTARSPPGRRRGGVVGPVRRGADAGRARPDRDPEPALAPAAGRRRRVPGTARSARRSRRSSRRAWTVAAATRCDSPTHCSSTRQPTSRRC